MAVYTLYYAHLHTLLQSGLRLHHCTKVTDEAVRLLSVGCQQLRWLDLYSCDKITDAALRHLGSGAGSTALECLLVGTWSENT
jgi:hypothetical protein